LLEGPGPVPDAARADDVAGGDRTPVAGRRGEPRVNGHVIALRAERGPRAAGRPDTTAQAALPRSDGSALGALREHWPEYLVEAGGLGLFMVSACLFATLLEHPSS